MTTQLLARAVRTHGAGESPFRRFRRRFVRQRGGLVLLGLLGLLVLVALGAPWLMPHDPRGQDLTGTLAGPSWQHLLGTDELGRDEFSRLIAATRTTLVAASIATVVSVVIGLPLGLFAGTVGRAFDVVLSRVNDALMAIPPLVFAMAMVAVLGPGVNKAMLAIGIVTAPRFFRVARGVALSIRAETYIEAARSIGSPLSHLVFRHVLPNAVSPLIVQVSVTMGFAVMFEASLSFLGLGVQAPEASWGSMLQNSTQFSSIAPHLVILPGLLIFLTVLAFNVVGDAIRDSLGREVRRP